MRKTFCAVAIVIFAAACGSSGMDLGSLGDILGSTSQEDRSDVRGTVVRVDTNDQRIDLDTQYINNLQDSRSGQSIYYSSNTVVQYQNNEYRPADLERGDEISIVGSNSNGRFVAERITVTRNVRN